MAKASPAHRLRDTLAAHALWLDSNGRQGTRANFGRANLEGVDLRGARLEKALFRYARLGGADFRDADLKGADFRGATFTVTITGYNELDLPREYAHARFDGAQLEGVLADRSLA